jgi:collagen type VII alpha
VVQILPATTNNTAFVDNLNIKTIGSGTSVINLGLDVNGNVVTGVTSGVNGTSGTSGTSGSSGTSGVDGSSGTSGINGTSGSSGTSGLSGTSGTSGVNGTSGTSGTSGINGTSGTSGINGSPGTSGTSGVSGSSGTSGAGGSLTILNNTNNNVITATGTSGVINGESNFRFDGTTAIITGNLNVSGGTGINWFSGNTSSDLVRITQTGSGDAFVVEDSVNPDTSHFVIDASGNTSIGTDVTGRKLTVSGDSTFIHNPITSLTSSVSGYGDIVTFGTGSLTAGNLYYLRSDGSWALADADSETSSSGFLAIALGSTATTSGMLVKGYVRSTAYTASTGAILYVSTTAGAITATAPSAAGDVVRIVGYQLDATNDVIYFNPSNDWINI